MAYLIPDRTGTIILKYGETPTAVDLSDYIRGVVIAQSPETSDVSTFTNPGATAVAKITTEMSLVGLWSEALLTALGPLVGVEATMEFKPTSSSGTIGATVRVETLPWGDFTVSQPVEVEIPLSVIVEPTLTPATP